MAGSEGVKIFGRNEAYKVVVGRQFGCRGIPGGSGCEFPNLIDEAGDFKRICVGSGCRTLDEIVTKFRTESDKRQLNWFFKLEPLSH